MAEVQAKEVAFNYNSIVAKPLVSKDFTSVKPKNNNLSFFWANRIAGNPSGGRVSQLEAAGFRVATITDCEVPGLKPSNGHWQYGDLLLLCIGKADYLGALKYNEQISNERLNPAVAAKKGMREAKGMTSKMFAQRKVSFIQPTEEEREALFNKSIQEV